MYECRSIYAEWTYKLNETKAHAWHEKDDPATTTYAEYDIFATSSNEQAPHSKDGKTDEWLFDACIPHCGKSNTWQGNLEWQMAQEVSTVGDGISPPGWKNQDRWVCKAGGGTLSTNQNNPNVWGYTPPGYK